MQIRLIVGAVPSKNKTTFLLLVWGIYCHDLPLAILLLNICTFPVGLNRDKSFVFCAFPLVIDGGKGVESIGKMEKMQVFFQIYERYVKMIVIFEGLK